VYRIPRYKAGATRIWQRHGEGMYSRECEGNILTRKNIFIEKAWAGKGKACKRIQAPSWQKEFTNAYCTVISIAPISMLRTLLTSRAYGSDIILHEQGQICVLILTQKCIMQR